MSDAFANHEASLDSPANNAASVTPSDSTDLANVARALWIGGAGDVSLVTVGGQTVTFAGVPAGAIVPIRTARVRSTSTTATSILALW